jgi:hypothetical protein
MPQGSENRPAVEFYAPGFLGPVVAKFALRSAFDAAPELARDFEVHLAN